MKKNKLKNNQGFTILETLVAIFILTLALTGPLFFSQSGLRAAFLARDQFTAFYLAQDAIEYIKNTRDSNGLSGDDWLKNIPECQGNGCIIDTLINSDQAISSCASGECPVLKFENDGGYGYKNGEDSIFSRTIYINYLNDYETELVVEVSWISNPSIGERKVVVQENIYNWIPTD